jgi:MFS family permease
MLTRLRNVNPSLLAIMAEGFFSRLSFGFITFALPLFAFRELGLGLTGIGVLLSFNLMVAIALKPLMGALADRFGLKQSLTTAIGLRSLVSLLLPFAAVSWQLFAIRGLHGVSIALRDPAVNALIAEHSAKKTIASTFAWYQTAKSVAGSAGKFLAGVLLTLTAANFTVIFLIAAALSLVPLLIVASFLQNPHVDLDAEGTAAWLDPDDAAAVAAAGQNGDAERREEKSARPRIAPFMGVGFFISGTAYMLTNLFPLLAVEYAGLTEAQTGAIYGLSTLVVLSGPGFGWLSDNVSRRLVMSVRSVANVLSSAVYLVAPNFAGMAVGRTVDDVGKAAFRPAWGALMAHVSSYDRRRRAQTMGYLSVGEDAGEVAGPILAGFLWSTWGVGVLLGVRIALSAFTEIYTIAVTGSLTRTGRERARRAESQEAVLVRRAIEAYNQGDFEGIQRYVHEDAEAYTFLVLRAATPFGGPNGISKTSSSGPNGISALLAKEGELGQEIRVESLDLVDGRVLGFGQVVLRGRGRRSARTVEAAWVWETRDGKISYMGFYLDPREALRAVGLPR